MPTNKEEKRTYLLAQAYNDVWDDYYRSLKSDGFPVWDYVVLTASNTHQAQIYEKQLKTRKDFLPDKTKFLIVSDENDERVGSGGATLSVIKKLREFEYSLNNLKILVIHSGGDSKRIPQYSVTGKLFSPVPHILKDGRSSTLFDELLASVSSVPGRIKEGMLLLSGDVLLLFNPLMIYFNGSGAAAVSFEEDLSIGKNHGVYQDDKNGFVKSFLHKQSPESLKEKGAVGDKGNVNIDTGAILFGQDILESLWSMISTDNIFDDNKYHELVNKNTRLSLYGDFIYSMASDSDLDSYYKEKPEGEFCEELHKARTVVWKTLNQYRMRLLKMKPAKFIHFGTSLEVLHLMSEGIEEYKELGWKKNINSIMKSGSAYNSIVDSLTEDSFYSESSYIHKNVRIGHNVIISNCEVKSGKTIPDNVVIHALKQLDNKYVCRIYGINDNPKENRLFGTETDRPLWEKELYPECETLEEALDYALKLHDLLVNGKIEMIEKWNNKKSLCSSFNEADPEAVFEWNNRLSDIIELKRIEEAIDNGIPVSEFCLNMKNGITDDQEKWIKENVDNSDLSKKMRFHYYLGKIADNEEEYIKAFRCLSDSILEETMNGLQENKDLIIHHDETTVKLPLRVNFGGGWSDTPPYCNENGGKVINASITLNGNEPITVVLKKLEEKKIVFESKDMDVYGEFTDIKELQSVGDPFDPFVLQKAVLLACGVIPKDGGDLKTVLRRLGGGIYMNSEVTDVPKGSGLGTSSILAVACVKALFEFMDAEYSEEDLYSHVLAMEQLMSTGGGWQDQVGGLTRGIKVITSKPGINQKLNVEHVKINENDLDRLNQRFTLIYTGQRRLARNLLRDVVGRYIGNEKDTVYALREIQNVAEDMKEKLLEGDIDCFGELLNRHWELSKMIDEGSTNELIDRIFICIDDLLSGKMVCGAGGGGFLQVLLKEGVDKNDLHKRLKECFPDTDIGIWDCKIV